MMVKQIVTSNHEIIYIKVQVKSRTHLIKSQ